MFDEITQIIGTGSHEPVARIPLGCWPRRMSAELAAGYVGERTVEAFICRVGKDYPNLACMKVADNYGSETTSTDRSYPQTWRTGTRQRTCDVQQAPAPFRHRQAPRGRKDRVLFPPARRLSQTRLSRTEEALGTDYDIACGANGDSGRAAALNARFDEWKRTRNGQAVSPGPVDTYGTVDWLFREYKASKAYLEKVAPRSRPDYERTMLLVTDLVTKTGIGLATGVSAQSHL